MRRKGMREGKRVSSVGGGKETDVIENRHEEERKRMKEGKI